MTIPIENKTSSNLSYLIKIHDPDNELTELNEVEMVHQVHELQHWEKLGKFDPKHSKEPRQFDFIVDKDTVLLPPGAKIDILFKFLTTREVSHSHLVKASADVVKQRNIKISFMSNMSIVK